MNRSLYPIVALLCLGVAEAQEQPRAVVMPDTPAATPPVPPPPAPDAVTRLAPDQLFVIEAKVPCLVITSPEGIASVTGEAGPLRIRAKFVGSDKVETKTFAGPHVYTVEGVKSGRIEVIVVPTGFLKPSEVVRRTIDVETGLGPIPPPGPPPGPPPPGPPPGPPPTPGALHVLISVEDGDVTKLPLGQQIAMTAASVRKYMNDKCAKGAGGQPEWRIWDKDLDKSKSSSPALIAADKREKKSLPWVYIFNGKDTFEGPVPDGEKAMLELLQKYGG